MRRSGGERGKESGDGRLFIDLLMWIQNMLGKSSRGKRTEAGGVIELTGGRF
jgi:hypothetical protein